MRGQADEKPGELDEEASTSSGSTASDTDSEGGGDNEEEEGVSTATLILALVQAASLMGCALESPHAFAGLSSARNTPITPPEEMIMAIGIFCFAGQVAFCKMCFDHKVPPSRIQRYMAAGLIVQLFWLRALSRRMWSTSSLLGLFNLFWCFEKAYNGAGVTSGVMYRVPDGESRLAPIIRRGECDPYKTQLGRFLFFPGLSAIKGLLIALVNVTILHSIPRNLAVEFTEAVMAWTIFVLLACSSACIIVLRGERGDLVLPSVVLATTLFGGAANRELGLVLSVYSHWQDQAIAIVQLSCVVRVAFSLAMATKPKEGAVEDGDGDKAKVE